MTEQRGYFAFRTSTENDALAMSQIEMFPDTVYLRRIDETQNMRRYYLIYVIRDLFGRWFLVREWGRIGFGGSVRREEYESFGPALDALSLWVQAKKRRGYIDT